MASQLAYSNIIGELVDRALNFAGLSSWSSTRSMKADAEKLLAALPRIRVEMVAIQEGINLNKHNPYPHARIWQVRDAIESADDVLDEIKYYELQQKIRARDSEIPEMSDSLSSSKKQLPHDFLQLQPGLADRISEAISQLNEVAKDCPVVHLHKEDLEVLMLRPAFTSLLVTETRIFGRELESEELVNFLLTDCDSRETVSVIPIVGEGGIGKTTLARLVHSNHRVRKQFNRFGWVSLYNYSDISGIMKSLMEFFSVHTCSETELSAVQRKISEEVKGKSVLLVLDDLSIIEQSYWQNVLESFKLTKMTRILVTTRHDDVARMVSASSPIRLGRLPEDQCWALFCHFAFKGMNHIEPLILREIERLIVKKCGGIPISVKLVASLLRHELVYVERWMKILQSGLWELNFAKELSPPLQISYLFLPPDLKQCFLHCSVFPKNYSFEKNNMVRHWISQGYVPPRGENTFEETANEYFQELVERSFFEHICDHFSLEGEYDSLFKVHDMIHDLAKCNSKDFNGYFSHSHLHVRGCVRSMNFPGFVKFSHLLALVVDFSNAEEMDLDIIVSAYNLRSLELRWGGGRIMLPESIGNLKQLRRLYIGSCEIETLPESISYLLNLNTLTIFNCSNLKELPTSIEKLIYLQYLNLGIPVIKRNILESICLLKRLQTLILNSPSLDELPESIGNLIDLRQLVLSNAKIRTLPKTISHLRKLRTLGFYMCGSFQELPNEIGNLTNLENLILRGSRVCCMRLVVHKLTALQRINATLLVSAENNGSALGILKDLVNLKGTLYLYGLEKVASLEDAKNANLTGKQFIEKLSFNWLDCRPIVGDEIDEFTLAVGVEGDKNKLAGKEMETLECFQPHPSLKQIEINGYNGVAFPKWVGDPLSCKMLKSMQIETCHNLDSLFLGGLSALKSLSIISCSGLEQSDLCPQSLNPYQLTGARC